MPIGCAVLMCHAPIVVPRIAGPRAGACRTTTQAMREVAQALVAHEPDVVVLISPHTPRRPDSWGIAHDSQLSGSFARFGHAEIALSLTGHPSAAQTLEQAAARRGLSVHPVSGKSLDHGAMVPLYFLHEAGFRAGLVLVALPFPGTESERVFGQAIREAAEARNERWAILASGDMSHRLAEDAPSGYDPYGQRFDDAFVGHLSRGELQRAITLDPELIERAAEDVVQSTAVAAGAIGDKPQGLRVVAYEGPFGVGYCEALLHSDRAAQLVPAPPEELVQVAHDAIYGELTGESYRAPILRAPWDKPRPVFVTLRSPSGELRGCIGRTEATQASLAEEIADCAVAAATRDYRMPSVELAELASLRIEVSVLNAPEPVRSADDLDPARYGIVVSRGLRRGVLLPQVEGITSVDDQLRVALRKGGIDPEEPYRLERFTVSKVARDRPGARAN